MGRSKWLLLVELELVGNKGLSKKTRCEGMPLSNYQQVQLLGKSRNGKGVALNYYQQVEIGQENKMGRGVPK